MTRCDIYFCGNRKALSASITKDDTDERKLKEPSQFRLILVPGRPPRSVAEHRAIVEAIASRDPEAAEAAMRSHLANSVETLRTLTRSYQMLLR